MSGAYALGTLRFIDNARGTGTTGARHNLKASTMKSSIVTRLYAIALSAVFASMATFGVAALMSSSGDDGRVTAAASAASTHGAPPKAELTKWDASPSKQVL